MKLFDLIKLMFTNHSKFEEVSNNIKAKNFFMINRRMSINWPLVANSFNKININPAYAVISWGQIAARFNSPPKWLYTSAKEKKAENVKQWEPSSECIEKFIRINKIGMRDYEDAMRLNPSVTRDYLMKIDKSLASVKI